MARSFGRRGGPQVVGLTWSLVGAALIASRRRLVALGDALSARLGLPMAASPRSVVAGGAALVLVGLGLALRLI